MSKLYLQSIECSAQPLDLSFHPTREYLVAAALVDGTVEVHDFRTENVTNNDHDDEDDDEHDSILSSLAVHTQLLPPKPGSASTTSKPSSCRAITFSVDGQHIYTGGSAGDICAFNAERACTFSSSSDFTPMWRIDEATAAGMYTPLQVLHPLGEPSPHLMASGDEAGGLRLWDLRLCGTTSNSSASTKQPQKPRGCVLSWEEHQDYISGIEHSEDCNTLLSTSADGRLGVFDLRFPRPANTKGGGNNSGVRLSDDQDDELLSIKVMKHGKKVVCGTHQGVLAVFSWGTWGDISDRFPGHPNSVDALLKVDEDTLLTGSSDGLIRVVSIHPDKFLGVVGEDHGGFPIEKLKFNSNRHVVGSVSHDAYIRLCDVRVLDDSYEDEEEGNGTSLAATTRKAEAAVAAATQGSTSKGRKADDSEDEWDEDDDDKDEEDDDEKDDSKNDDDDDDSDDSDDSDSDKDDDDDEEAPTTNQKRAKRLKTDNEKFFEDL